MILLYSCIISLILIIWLRTEAWLEYTRLLKLNKLSFYEDYDQKRSEDLSLTYIIYLRRYHNSFFVRLITCPICLSVWLGIISGLISSIILIPIYIMGGLLLYTTIDKLLG